MKISAKTFPFTFFLSDRVRVDDIEQAAKTHGGATLNKETNVAWSNVHKSEYITVNKDSNTIGIFIPDTVNVSSEGKEKQMEVLQKVDQLLAKKYEDIEYAEGLGTWFSESENRVVYDNIIIVSVTLPTITIEDINYFVMLAQMVKEEMEQEGVSIAINDALAIV